METALQTERTALREQGGVTDGTLATNVKPSTPRAPADVRPERVTSRDPDAFPVITGREEEWRFTPLDRLRPLLDGADSDARLQWKTELPDGVTLREVAYDDALLADVPVPVDRLSALAMSRSTGAVVVRVPAEAALTEPIVLHLSGTGESDVVWAHVVLDIGR